jgi:hypothetical protein
MCVRAGYSRIVPLKILANVNDAEAGTGPLPPARSQLVRRTTNITTC